MFIVVLLKRLSGFLLLLPITATATVFAPLSDMNIVLSGNTRFNFESYTVAEGLRINYVTPENTTVEIISDDNIEIFGMVSLLATGSTFSLTSLGGTISVFGNIITQSFILRSISTRSIDGNGLNGVVLSQGADVNLSTGGETIPLLGDPEIIGGQINLSAPNIDLSGSQLRLDGSLLIPSAVPIPAPIFLFASSLLLLLSRKLKLFASHGFYVLSHKV